MSFSENYEKISDLVKSEIDKVQNSIISDISVCSPLNTELKKLLSSPSKHIRPLVSFLYLKASGFEIDEKQIKYQSAIEAAHNASLIHDDIIDESDTRRDCKTLNKTFTNQLAVISGDYLLSLALQKVLDIGINELSVMFCTALQNMTIGEINQYFGKFNIPTLADYIDKSEKKTAELFKTAVSGSMLIAKSKDSGLDFAKNFGIAFQIRDDLINCKISQSDIKEGIYTAPVIFSDSAEITQDGIEKTQSLLNNYLDNTLKDIDHLPENIYKSGLTELVRILRNE